MGHEEGADHVVTWPEPQPAHVRDGVRTEALVDSEHAPVPYAEHQKVLDALILARRSRGFNRTKYLEAAKELDALRKIVGNGPHVVVKLSDLSALTDSGAVEVRVGFGGGVTRHMLPTILGLGLQACEQEAPAPEACHWCLSGRDDCPRHAQKPQEPLEWEPGSRYPREV